MSDFLLSYGVASYISQDILIVPFQADFYVEVIDALRQDILQQLHDTPDIKGLVIDLSNVNLIDLQDMNVLERTLDMAAVFDVMSFLVGIKPSVTLALIELGYDPKHLNSAPNIEQAILSIHHATKTLETHIEVSDMACDDVDDQAEEQEINDAC